MLPSAESRPYFSRLWERKQENQTPRFPVARRNALEFAQLPPPPQEKKKVRVVCVLFELIIGVWRSRGKGIEFDRYWDDSDGVVKKVALSSVDVYSASMLHAHQSPR